MDWIKKNLIIVLLNFLSMIVGSAGLWAFTSTMTKLDNKADKVYVDKEVSNISKSIITIDEVDEEIKEAINIHEVKEKEVYLRLENIIILSLEKQEAVVKSIDKRLERLENKN